MTTYTQAFNGLVEVVNSAKKAGRRLDVLEAGGGSLSHLPLPPDVDVTVVDISPEQLERNQYAKTKVLADLHEVELPRDRYDLVVCWDVLEHLENPAVVAEKLLASTKPGGFLVIAAPNQNSLTGLITKFTPHWFHVAVYRHLFDSPNAGKPGYAPFPTFMRSSMAPRRLRGLLESRGGRIVYSSLYEAGRAAYVREKSPMAGSLYFGVLAATRLLSLGRAHLELSDFFLVATKGDGDQGAGRRRSPAANTDAPPESAVAR